MPDGAGGLGPPLFTDTTQIAIVVADLDSALRTYVDEYGIGPWEIFEFNPATADGMTVDEAPIEYAMRVAMTHVGRTQWELIEPLDDRSIYAAFLAATGGGLHHVAVSVDDYGQALHALREKGHRVLQGGSYKGATFAYLSTDRDLGLITEIVDWPRGVKHEPDAVFPPHDTHEAADPV